MPSRPPHTSVPSSPPRAAFRLAARLVPGLALCLASCLAPCLAPSAAWAQAQGPDYAAGPIRIGHPWTPPAPEGARSAPGYLTLTNTGRTPDRLVSGSFIEATHLVIEAAPAGRGQPAPADGGLVIGPGETVVLRPGGPRLMFVDLKGALPAGRTFQSILRFERAGTALIEFAVEGPAGKPRPGRAKGAAAVGTPADRGVQARAQ